MPFEDALAELSAKTAEYEKTLATEEATKTAIIMPFIGRVLGYDIFNPNEVIPEYVCDIGTKKGEKVDYAIVRDGQVLILIEAKKIGEPLAIEHASQLVRYFSVSKARIAVLTNGREWRFYSDLDRPNVMDDTPFLTLDLLSVDSSLTPDLKKLAKDSFDLDSVLATAEDLKWVGAIKRDLASIFNDPPDDLIRFIAGRVYQGRYTPTVRETFARLTGKAMRQFVNDRVRDRIKQALDNQPQPEVSEATDEDRDEVETTLDEREGFAIVRAIVVSEVPYTRVIGRDTKSYFGILIDDNNRKPLCRLHFNRTQKYLGLLDEDKVETRVPLEVVEDIYMHADALREAARRYR